MNIYIIELHQIHQGIHVRSCYDKLIVEAKDFYEAIEKGSQFFGKHRTLLLKSLR